MDGAVDTAAPALDLSAHHGLLVSKRWYVEGADHELGNLLTHLDEVRDSATVA